MSKTKWTHFHDMHSGGGLKEKWGHIYIEAPQDEAEIVFFNRFGHSPHRVSCTCCGEDYSLTESNSLEQATGYERGCHYDPMKDAYEEVQYFGGVREILGKPYQTLEQFLLRGNVLVIKADEIKPEERIGELPEQGYVWQD